MESDGATINQPEGMDIGVSDKLSWTDGALNTIDSGAAIALIGNAIGTVAPAEYGTLHTSSLIYVGIGSKLNVDEGEVQFLGNFGVSVAGELKLSTSENAELYLSDGGVSTTDKVISVDKTGKLTVIRKVLKGRGSGTFDLPIATAGFFHVMDNVTLKVNGRIGTDGPSISQSKGSSTLNTGSRLTAKYGFSITGGDFSTRRVDSSEATIIGNFTFNPGQEGTLGFNTREGTSYAQLSVYGTVTWSSGIYVPRFNGTVADSSDLWWTYRQFRVGAAATLAPDITMSGAVNPGATWRILQGTAGVKDTAGTANAPTPPLPQEAYFMQTNNDGDDFWWMVSRRKVID